MPTCLPRSPPGGGAESLAAPFIDDYTELKSVMIRY